MNGRLANRLAVSQQPREQDSTEAAEPRAGCWHPCRRSRLHFVVGHPRGQHLLLLLLLKKSDGTPHRTTTYRLGIACDRPLSDIETGRTVSPTTRTCFARIQCPGNQHLRAPSPARLRPHLRERAELNLPVGTHPPQCVSRYDSTKYRWSMLEKPGKG